MSLDKITQDYINQYKLKGITPEWLTLLTKTVNSRNVSTVDWNIAMDDIRKVASDSAATHNFIKAFNEEFNEYYKRNIKSIHYTTDSEDKLSNTVLDNLTLTPDNKLKNDKVKFSVDTLETYKHGTGEEVLYCSGLNDGTKDVGFIMNFKESTYVENIQLYVRSVAASVNIKICTSADGNTYTEDNVHNLYLQNFGSSVDVYLIPVGMYVKTIKIVQPSGEGYTEGRFSICGIEMYKSNLTGVWVLTKYDGSKITIPMVDPADFAKQIQKYLDNTYTVYADTVSVKDSAVKELDIQISNQASAFEDFKTQTDKILTDQATSFEKTLKDLQDDYVEDLNSVSGEHVEDLTSIKDSYASELNFIKEETLALKNEAVDAKVEAISSKILAADSATEAKQHLDALVEAADDPYGFLRLDSNGMIPISKIPAEKTIEMYPITSVNDLTTLSKAQTGDIAYIVNASGTATEANYRLVGEDYSVRSNWILQTTTYVSQAALADRATVADDTSKVAGVTVRFGSLSEFNSSDKGGLYIITDYSESESV